jgi:hypothetical protein
LFLKDDLISQKLEVISLTSHDLRKILSRLSPSTQRLSYLENHTKLDELLSITQNSYERALELKRLYYEELKNYYDLKTKEIKAHEARVYQFEVKANKVQAVLEQTILHTLKDFLPELTFLAFDRHANFGRIMDLHDLQEHYFKRKEDLQHEKERMLEKEEILKIINSSLIWGIVR